MECYATPWGGSYFFAAYCAPDLIKMPIFHPLHWSEAIAEHFEKFSMGLFIKIVSRREAKFTISAWKLTISDWKWYYSFIREIFSFGQFFRSKHFLGQNTFSKIVAVIIYEGQIRLEVDKFIHHSLFLSFYVCLSLNPFYLSLCLTTLSLSLSSLFLSLALHFPLSLLPLWDIIYDLFPRSYIDRVSHFHP